MRLAEVLAAPSDVNVDQLVLIGELRLEIINKDCVTARGRP